MQYSNMGLAISPGRRKRKLAEKSGRRHPSHRTWAKKKKKKKKKKNGKKK
jgi:hypothetical protein